jgi:hypothetical protein
MFEVVAKAGQEYTCKPEDPHEEQKYLALHILKLAAQCRVSSFAHESSLFTNNTVESTYVRQSFATIACPCPGTISQNGINVSS